uniref:Ig-like domain-containing protein n=1 Tax=Chelydra serpentina TaxID=8475 RepID=A0A8C3SSV9_CHESE
ACPLLTGLGRGWCLTLCLLLSAEMSPKPALSLSPGRATALGQDVTVRCRAGRRDARFSLFKVGDRTPLGRAEPAGAGGEFLTRSVRRGDGGSYTCYYHYATDPCTWSEPSDPVELVVAGREYPKPTIWVSPSRVVALGGSVTIRCGGRYRSMEFFLRKAGHPNPQVQTVPDGTVAEFPIPSVGREDGGSYTCEYHPITEQNRWSYPSNPVEIIVAGEGPGSVSRLPAPHPARPSGGLCTDVDRRGMRFVLDKERRHFPHVDSVGFQALFSISNVRREHGGSYSCSYHSRSEPFAVSYPSDPVELVVRGEGPGSASPFPPPARPSRGLGANGTLRFRIPTVGRQHGGSYSCSYRPRSEPFVSSLPSDPMQLVVAGEGPGSRSLLPAGPSEGRHQMGCSEPGSAQSPRTGLDRELGRSHWGFPSQGGAAAPGDSGLRKRDPCPQGELQSRGPFPGDAPPAAPTLGTHRGIMAQGLPSRHRPQPQTPLPGAYSNGRC